MVFQLGEVLIDFIEFTLRSGRDRSWSEVMEDSRVS